MRFWVAASVVLVVLLAAFEASAWGDEHRKITRRALELLPKVDTEMFGSELTNMPWNSTIPDRAYCRMSGGKERFVWDRLGTKNPDTQGRKFVNSHLMFTTPENLDLLLWCVTNAVNAAKARDYESFGGFAGCLAHALEDWTTPAHTTVDDNMMNHLRTLLPPPPGTRFWDSKMHGRIEGGGFTLADVSYAPRILAESPEELAYRLLIHAQAGQLVARAQLVPILQAVYAGDGKASAAAQRIGGIEGLKLVADAFHTMAALARGDARREAGSVPLFECWPDELPGLYYPQSFYAWSPTWKPLLTRYYRKDSNEPVPDAWFFSPSGSKRISWTIPPRTFRRFTCRLTRHADEVSTRPIEMRIRENGRERVAATLPEERSEIPVSFDISPAVTNLSISFACAKPKDPSAKWIIWPVVINPRLEVK